MQADRRSREPQVVARTEWVHANADVPASPLTLTVPAQVDRELFVVVAEGDNTSLPRTRPAPAAVVSCALLLAGERHVASAYGRRDLA